MDTWPQQSTRIQHWIHQNRRPEHEAAASFLQANRLNKSLYVPNLFLGIDYAHTGKVQSAITFLVKAEELNGADPQAPLVLGRVYISTGRFSAAVQQLDRATNLAPKLGAAWFALGIAHLDLVEDDARIISKENKESPFARACPGAYTCPTHLPGMTSGPGSRKWVTEESGPMRLSIEYPCTCALGRSCL